MTKQMEGFSILSMLIWGMILGGSGLYATAVWPIYSAYWKTQDTFDGVVKNLSKLSEQSIRERLPQLLRTQYLNPESLPKEFYEHLEVTSDGEGYVKISSSYHITAWFFGQPDINDPKSGEGIEIKSKWDDFRRQWKEDFEMKPYAESAHEAP
ncbi:MAG: hypothetical protein Q9M15_02010 [Mariprofundaceae bacterium]|nr:hypothetical protein [Mariprofundaceae bacterium]